MDFLFLWSFLFNCAIILVIMKYKELFKYARDNNQIIDFEEEAIYFLIEEINHLKRHEIILKMNDNVDNEDRLMDLINKYIKDNIPVQYLLNTAYFYGNKFYVNEDVLIPRFDTEILVDKSIELIGSKKCRIVDIGTGSGIIAISIKLKCENAIVDAIDISPVALDVAKKNAHDLNADINFIENDMLESIDTKYDFIISNPPYIDNSEYVSDIVRSNEPSLALFSEDKGMYHYKKIIQSSLNNLNDDVVLIFEIPDNKCDALVEYASMYYQDIEYIKDYNNQRRVLIIKKRK